MLDDTDRIRELENALGRLTDRMTRADIDRIHSEADLENFARNHDARISKLELWQSWVIGALSVTLLAIGAIAGPIISKVKGFLFG